MAIATIWTTPLPSAPPVLKRQRVCGRGCSTAGACPTASATSAAPIPASRPSGRRQRDHHREKCDVFGQQQLPAAHGQQAVARESAFAIESEQALRVAGHGADHEHRHRQQRLVRQRRAEDAIREDGEAENQARSRNPAWKGSRAGSCGPVDSSGPGNCGTRRHIAVAARQGQARNQRTRRRTVRRSAPTSPPRRCGPRPRWRARRGPR